MKKSTESLQGDRHTAKYLPFRCSADKAREITDYANSRHLLISEAMRELIDAGLKAKGATADEDQLYDTVKAAVDEVLKPGIERLAAINAKATQLEAASFFMQLYTMSRDGSPEEQERIQQAMSDARRLGIQYLKVKDNDIDRFLRAGAQQIGEDN